MLNVIFFIILLVVFWRQIFSGGAIGFFSIFNFVFVLFGLLGWPLFKDQAVDLFFAFDLSLVADEAPEMAAQVVLLGLWIVHLSYWLMSQVARTRQVGLRIGLSYYDTHVVSTRRFLLIGTPVLLVALYFILQRMPALVSGFSGGGATATLEILEARSEYNANYFGHQILQNILPVIAVISFVRYRISRTTENKIVAILFTFTAIVGMLTLFKKGPLMVTAIQYLIAYHATAINGRLGRVVTPKFFIVENWRAMVFMLFSTSFLYFIFSGYYLPSEVPIENVWHYLVVSLSRIIGRLSIPAILYADYFPQRHEFYGFSNVGLISSIFSTPLYLDTTDVYSYYSIDPREGSVAASAIIDFYGQSGLLGVIFGSVFLGLLLALFDTWLNNRKFSDGSVAIYCIAISFAYYLSQASIFRSLAGYGGIFYLAVWILMYGTLSANRIKKEKVNR